MLDQSFSFHNLKIIHEIENRKGNYFINHYSPEFHDIVDKIEQKRNEIRYEKAKALFDDYYRSLIREREELEIIKDKCLEQDLMNISEEINNSSFNFILNPFIPTVGAKTIYSVRDNAATYFAIKQLQYNIFRTFKVKQSNRHQIVRQVENLFDDGFPKLIIRTDIEQFYESVPQHLLLELIDNNQLLSPKSKNLIKNILYNYNLCTGQLTNKNTERIGIPRGVGISAFLAELYMRKIDEEIKSIEGLTYYGRYVDDMIIIFTPKSKLRPLNYKELIGEIVKDRGLKIKDDKTFVVNLLNGGNTTSEIIFLGYKFQFSPNAYLGVKLSNNKKLRYKEKVVKTLESFLVQQLYDRNEARRLLIHRLNYLTKNTRLHKPKKGMIGIYYSNSLLSQSCTCLTDLDRMLHGQIDVFIPMSTFGKLNERLKRFSFSKGFKEKLYFNISSKRKNIPDVRPPYEKKERPLVNNFEKIVDAWKDEN